MTRLYWDKSLADQNRIETKDKGVVVYRERAHRGRAVELTDRTVGVQD